jgi:hypothetical protein
MAAENIQNRAADKFLNLESVVARSLWPTPQARDWKGPSGRSLKGQENDLPNEVKMWPTPTAVTKEEEYEVWLARMQRKTDAKSNSKTKPSDLGIAVKMAGEKTKGSLNPRFVEWLMGYPEDWTRLDNIQDGQMESQKGCKG